jgi:hypothetical protein
LHWLGTAAKDARDGCHDALCPDLVFDVLVGKPVKQLDAALIAQEIADVLVAQLLCEPVRIEEIRVFL